MKIGKKKLEKPRLKMLVVYLTVEQAAEIEALAEERDDYKAEVVRDIVSLGLEENRKLSEWKK